ncbi:hypothetical protein [Streptomyces sp. URMC 123]|uniref:hypothetical protein n=1 Tax=Streptomyces sp. URMC 123 TaxID=3423403 RepID=UPI003F19BA6D
MSNVLGTIDRISRRLRPAMGRSTAARPRSRRRGAPMASGGNRARGAGAGSLIGGLLRMLRGSSGARRPAGRRFGGGRY